MRDVLGKGLNRLKRNRVRKNRMIAVLLVLSLIVALDVFWVLRRPGLTLAGDADCGIIEHIHDDECKEKEKLCKLEEHAHGITCYSDDTADVESQIDWKKMFSDYPYTGDLRKDLVGIAQTQVGYSESTSNFEVGSDGIRRGYTRYGEWYGAPYMDWSAAFVSFCLQYAGANPQKNPGNIGADSMAESWKKLGKYVSYDEYKPVPGDLAFFKNNTVGIVVEVYKSSFYVIRGDEEDVVSGEVIALTDATIKGWGATGGTLSQDKVSESDYLLDISNGPAIYILEGQNKKEQKQTLSLKASRTIVDIIPYLEGRGGNYFFTLLDKNNQELSKDASGNYVVQPDTGYKLTIGFASPEGFAPGTYQYQLPDGLLADGGEGTFVLKDGTNVGSWIVSDDGLITLIFNEHMNSRTDITISATLGILFPEQEEPIDFDGKITVKVEKPPQQLNPTELYKWGVQGTEGNNTNPDPQKIYWTVQIVGNKDSQIPGSVLTDQVLFGEWSKDHRFTPSDMAGGLTFGVSESDPETGEEKAWHSWRISTDDPNLNWTETGWSYVIPEKATCQWCGEVNLGNNGWVYTINYSSTPDYAGNAGTFGYENEVTVDGQYAYAWTDFTHGEIHGEVSKKGSLVSDASGGAFHWEIQATIPAMSEGQKADHFWYIMDYMDMRKHDGTLAGYVTNDANRAKVTANYNGTTIHVPHVRDATVNDPYAWHDYWSTDHNDGIYYGRQLNLLSRCNCTEENCPVWNKGKCGSEYWIEEEDGNWYTNGYCQCWTATENTTFTFVYETDDLSIIENYGGHEHQLRNEAVLYNKPNGSVESVLVSSAQDLVTIPGMFKKELTHDFDGYTANYKITINEEKLVLTNGAPLKIHDVMTKTLAYISGSLVVTTEDANGNTTTLKQDVDYTVAYDGTGNATDEKGTPVHVLDIVILRPQPVKYILDYDTMLIIPPGTTQAIKYSNSATVTLWGEDITDSSVEKVYADINIAAKSYKVELFKTSALTGESLGGATFGLFNAQGGLIATDVTNTNGPLVFQSDIVEGIILREHVLYYMQELKPPPGYQLDDTKYWFCFCNDTRATCKICTEIMAGKDATRIPFEQIGKMHVTNEPMYYVLPATGGPGIYPIMLAGMIFIIAPLVYRFIRRRKQERRGVG